MKNRHKIIRNKTKIKYVPNFINATIFLKANY